MGTRIVCDDSTSQSKIDYYELPLGSNFKLNFHLFDPRYSTPKPIDISKLDFTIRYFIAGRSESYVCSKVGYVYTNCSVGDSPNIIKCIFDNYPLKTGILKAEVRLSVVDGDMPDGELSKLRTIELGIKLT